MLCVGTGTTGIVQNGLQKFESLSGLFAPAAFSCLCTDRAYSHYVCWAYESVKMQQYILRANLMLRRSVVLIHTISSTVRWSINGRKWVSESFFRLTLCATSKQKPHITYHPLSASLSCICITTNERAFPYALESREQIFSNCGLLMGQEMLCNNFF